MHESGIGPYGLRNRPSAKRRTFCAPLTRDRLTIRSGLRCGCMPRASPKARQSSASSVVLTDPRARTMATIPTRTASGRRSQTDCWFSHLRRDLLATISPPIARRGWGAISGAAWPSPVGACQGGARSRFQNPEKNQEPTVDSGSTPLGALRGWATPTAAPCHWLEHRLHKPGVAKPADDRGTPTHLS